MKYIIPEFFQDFKCKCGECRHSCCDGWPIRISRKEYYHLIGLKCSDQLRALLDCALKTSLEPDVEAFAQISTDWRGICKLHREDGLCALQQELGESCLPKVCRLYPRNTRKLSGNCTFAFSNSCEKVVELLMNLKEPLRFEEKDLPVNPEFDIKLPSEKYELCNKSKTLLQDRSLPLPERFTGIGRLFCGDDFCLKKADDLTGAFQFLNVLNNYFVSSNSICDYCQITQRYFGYEGTDKLSEEELKLITIRYAFAYRQLEVVLPDWQILFEQLITNHMFYNNFPYFSNEETTEDAFLALIITYSFLRFHFLGYMAEKKEACQIADFFAAMFRLIDHSNFRFIAVYLFKEGCYSEQDCVPQLLTI